MPVIGDLVGVILSSYILAEAARLGAGRRVLGRMAFNIAIEGLVGMIPLAGDVFDAGWKANQRNVRLLGAWLGNSGSDPEFLYPEAMWHKRVALALAILAPVLLVASGLGVQAGLWPFRFGFGMFAGALVVGLVAAGIAALALAVPRLRTGSAPLLVAALLLGLASAAVPLEHIRRVKTLPYINDITTDTETPPQFSLPHKYQSHFAELQRIGYPDLAPLQLPVPAAQAFARARAAAQAAGWEVTAADEKAGRIEATATTRWFGFKDDIVIRITPAGSGSRVDMRSRSRVGRSDLGANAQRIRAFWGILKASFHENKVAP